MNLVHGDNVPTVEDIDSYGPEAIWSRYKYWKQFNNEGNFDSKDRDKSIY